jgi:hypothetical protein
MVPSFRDREAMPGTQGIVGQYVCPWLPGSTSGRPGMTEELRFHAVLLLANSLS